MNPMIKQWMDRAPGAAFNRWAHDGLSPSELAALAVQALLYCAAKRRRHGGTALRFHGLPDHWTAHDRQEYEAVRHVLNRAGHRDPHGEAVREINREIARDEAVAGPRAKPPQL